MQRNKDNSFSLEKFPAELIGHITTALNSNTDIINFHTALASETQEKARFKLLNNSAATWKHLLKKDFGFIVSEKEVKDVHGYKEIYKEIIKNIEHSIVHCITNIILHEIKIKAEKAYLAKHKINNLTTEHEIKFEEEFAQNNPYLLDIINHPTNPITKKDFMDRLQSLGLAEANKYWEPCMLAMGIILHTPFMKNGLTGLLLMGFPRQEESDLYALFKDKTAEDLSEFFKSAVHSSQHINLGKINLEQINFKNKEEIIGLVRKMESMMQYIFKLLHSMMQSHSNLLLTHFIEKNPEIINDTLTIIDGSSLLNLAIQALNTPIIKLLLSKEADANHVVGFAIRPAATGYFLLNLARTPSPLYIVLMVLLVNETIKRQQNKQTSPEQLSNYSDIITLLLQHGANPAMECEDHNGDDGGSPNKFCEWICNSEHFSEDIKTICRMILNWKPSAKAEEEGIHPLSNQARIRQMFNP